MNSKRFFQVYALLVFILAISFSRMSFAIPFASFTGDLDYTSSDQMLSASGFVIAVDDIAAEHSDLMGSAVSFNAKLDSVTSAGSLTIASFFDLDSSLSVTSNLGDVLIDAVLVDTKLTGWSGSNFGIFEADFFVTGGSFLSDFDNDNQLFSLVFNMDQTVGSQMFDVDFTGGFSGDMNGRLELSGLVVMPEPDSLSLLFLGVITLSLFRIAKHRLSVSGFSNIMAQDTGC